MTKYILIRVYFLRISVLQLKAGLLSYLQTLNQLTKNTFLHSLKRAPIILKLSMWQGQIICTYTGKDLIRKQSAIWVACSFKTTTGPSFAFKMHTVLIKKKYGEKKKKNKKNRVPFSHSQSWSFCRVFRLKQIVYYSWWGQVLSDNEGSYRDVL